MTALAWFGIGCGVAVVIFMAAAIFAAIKKIALGSALAIFGLGIAFAAFVAAGIVAAVFLGRKNETGSPGTLPTDSDSASIGTAFDERRNQLKARIEEILHKGGGG